MDMGHCYAYDNVHFAFVFTLTQYADDYAMEMHTTTQLAIRLAMPAMSMKAMKVYYYYYWLHVELNSGRHERRAADMNGWPTLWDISIVIERCRVIRVSTTLSNKMIVSMTSYYRPPAVKIITGCASILTSQSNRNGC